MGDGLSDTFAGSICECAPATAPACVQDCTPFDRPVADFKLIDGRVAHMKLNVSYWRHDTNYSLSFDTGLFVRPLGDKASIPRDSALAFPTLSPTLARKLSVGIQSLLGDVFLEIVVEKCSG